MDNTILPQKVRLQINIYYQRVSDLLLDPKSYRKPVKIDIAQTYLKFIEEGAKSDYARILHVFYYIVDENLGLCDSTKPFEVLKVHTKLEIETLFYLAKWIVEGCYDDLEMEL